MEFEINFLVLQSHTENLETIKEKVQKLIETHLGQVTDRLEYRKRKLAYKINHEQYGFFTVFRFTMQDNDALQALRKDLNLSKDLARYLIVRADELPSLKEETAPAEQEKQQMREKDTIKHEDIEKILSGKKVQQEKQPQQAAQQQKVQEPKQHEEIATTEEPKEKEQPAPEETPERKDKDGKSSLDDLDKKLDEILNI